MGEYIIDLIALVFALGVGFGLSCWIFGTILEKSNLMGDNNGDRRYYKAYAKFSTRKDNINKAERESFCSVYGMNISKNSDGPGGQLPVRKLTVEEIARYNHTTVAAAAKEHSERINELENEVRLWENKSPNGSLSGVFSKLDEEELNSMNRKKYR